MELESSYTGSAYLSTDQAALNDYFSANIEDQDIAGVHSDVDNGNDIPSTVDGVMEEIPAKKIYSTRNAFLLITRTLHYL